MKVYALYIGVFISWMMSCSRGADDELRAFIPGTYVREIDHAFAVGMDTLIIIRLEAGMYRIEKRSGLRRLYGGKKRPFESRKERWLGKYEEKTGMIQVLKNGKLLFFDQDKNRLLPGSLEYRGAI